MCNMLMLINTFLNNFCMLKQHLSISQPEFIWLVKVHVFVNNAMVESDLTKSGKYFIGSLCRWTRDRIEKELIANSVIYAHDIELKINKGKLEIMIYGSSTRMFQRIN